MSVESETSCLISSFLLKINAVRIDPQNPFTWTSGIKSPMYCDLRQTISFPQVRRQITLQFVRLIKEHFPKTELIAGVATGAIAPAVLVAEELGLPFVYVRSGAKTHGLGKTIEGRYTTNQQTVVIEDLVSTGKSSMQAVTFCREAGLDVLGMLSVFTYGLPDSVQALREGNCKLFALTDYECLLQTALSDGTINMDELKVLQNWRKNPWNWIEERP